MWELGEYTRNPLIKTFGRCLLFLSFSQDVKHVAEKTESDYFHAKISGILKLWRSLKFPTTSRNIDKIRQPEIKKYILITTKNEYVMCIYYLLPLFVFLQRIEIPFLWGFENFHIILFMTMTGGALRSGLFWSPTWKAFYDRFSFGISRNSCYLRLRKANICAVRVLYNETINQIQPHFKRIFFSYTEFPKAMIFLK